MMDGRYYSTCTVYMGHTPTARLCNYQLQNEWSKCQYAVLDNNSRLQFAHTFHVRETHGYIAMKTLIA